MAIVDYEALDEEDFYGQGFREEGIVSVWLGTESLADAPDELDVLQDYCGVGYYNMDSHDEYTEDYILLPSEYLLRKLSYSDSFFAVAQRAAARVGVEQARYVIAQYDYEYDPSEVKRSAYAQPIFIGAFPYART
jgi:hypothetical protein